MYISVDRAPYKQSGFLFDNILITGKELTFLPKEAVENAMEAEVTGVDLSKNYLDKFPPQLEPLMKQLYELNLSSNRLTVLTPSIIGLGKN